MPKIIRTPNPDVSVSVKNLYGVYDENKENQFVALNNVSFDFAKNKIYCIIGNSGSGKSTLVTHFNGLLMSKYGYIMVDDIVAGDYYNISNHLLGVIDKKDNVINNQLWNYKLDDWNFLVLFTKQVNKKIARILFEGAFKRKVKSIRFIKDLNFTRNYHLNNVANIAVIRIDEDSNLEIPNTLSFEQLRDFEVRSLPNIKTNYKLTSKLRQYKKIRKKVGFVFQFPEYQLFKHTIEQDIMFGPMNFGVKKQEAKQRAKKYLNKLGLSDEYLEYSPFGLSGGQKRRVAIAGILAIETDMLIFDEPTAGLDPVGEMEMMQIILDAKKENKTVFVITHTMDHVLEIADEVIVMHEGEIIRNGSAYEIFSDLELMQKTSIEPPKVISTINQLRALDSSFDELLTIAPKTIEELADAIVQIKQKKGK
ncbi:ATP-binding cassette domain-containing protein [Ureaplasma miroungigenitalium]|uniref:ATP-binding cassette domain-containing protein n=1 Tax=Ureaplasma miroungigenitalium TaxID=1042321 RepID=A0ABT3BMM3_9BACT|nr:ATP-binding cassette domain-containing protein [Ureaplasma miroungigenitalium]MCV3728277.1 ATP-binding cassette domain-containing protein [Ureaplasma miroungigenitalium]